MRLKHPYITSIGGQNLDIENTYFFSPDNKFLFFTLSTSNIQSVCKHDLTTNEVNVISYKSGYNHIFAGIFDAIDKQIILMKKDSLLFFKTESLTRIKSQIISNNGKSNMVKSGNDAFLYTPYSEVVKYNYKTGVSQKSNLTSRLTMSPNERYSASSFADIPARTSGVISIQDLQIDINSTAYSYTQKGSMITAMAFSNDSKHIFAGDGMGRVTIHDLTKGELVATIFNFNDGKNWAIVTPDNYYMSSKKNINEIFFAKGLNAYSFDQFDLQYNRPDIVLDRMGKSSPQFVTAYYNAWKKRVGKMGFDPTNFEVKQSFNVPEIQLAQNAELIVETTSPMYDLKFSAEDELFNLDRLFINVNGVPLYGVKGKSLLASNIKTINQDISIPLSAGKNVIKVSVMNEKGVESLAEQFEITYKPSTPIIPNLHVIAIGVSKFVQRDYNLTYADKDANDLLALFKNAKGYGQVITHSFNNEQATVENILALRSELEKTKVDDEVIIFVASHGLLDNDLDYYLAMHNTQFENPKNGGLRYDVLENLLDGIPARNKLMLIDACHSGEVDKEESTLIAANTSTTTSGEIKSRGFKTIEIQSAGIGLQSSFELMKELFADLRRNNGAVVISSASGKEYAFESAQWQNGVFTYSLLEGIKSGNADANKDKTISVAEIRDYLGKRVVELTKGKQNPTSRTENLENDFRVW